MAAKIKHLCGQGFLQHEIAARFGINQGRVSEIKNGKKHKDVPPDRTPPVDPQPMLPF
jgi:predicted XRE-type DNA-binding protein